MRLCWLTIVLMAFGLLTACAQPEPTPTPTATPIIPADEPVAVLLVADDWLISFYRAGWTGDTVALDFSVGYEGLRQATFGKSTRGLLSGCAELGARDAEGNQVRPDEWSPFYCRSYWPGESERGTVHFTFGPRSSDVAIFMTNSSWPFHDTHISEGYSVVLRHSHQIPLVDLPRLSDPVFSLNSEPCASQDISCR